MELIRFLKLVIIQQSLLAFAKAVDETCEGLLEHGRVIDAQIEGVFVSCYDHFLPGRAFTFNLFNVISTHTCILSVKELLARRIVATA